MHKIILINVSGSDRPGLTRSLAEALAGFKVRVLDIGGRRGADDDPSSPTAIADSAENLVPGDPDRAIDF